MWKKPNRPNNEVTQSFNDGIIKFYSVEDEAEPGYTPVEKLIYKSERRYEERKLGIQRYYSARQNQVKLSRVVRCPKTDISSQDAAITEDCKQYRIDLVQTVPNVYPASVDVTLVLIDQKYEVPV